jgi:hypothetical protein
VPTHNSSGGSYSALQPYSYIVVDPTPYSVWVRTEFEHPWLKPNALNNTALTYLLDLSPASEVESLIDHALASISPDDDIFFSGDNFVAHPYALFAGNQGGGSYGDWSNAFYLPSNVPVGSAGYRRTSTNSDPIPANDAPSAIPEPSTAALFAGLGAILVYLGRLRASNSASQVE